MHPLAIGSTTATAVGIQPGVVALRTAAAAAARAAAATAAATAAAFTHGDVGAATALITLGGHDLVVVRSQVHAVARPAIEVVTGGDGSAGPLRLSHAPVLIERL